MSRPVRDKQDALVNAFTFTSIMAHKVSDLSRGGPSRQNGARQVGDPGTVAFWAVGERPRAPLRPDAHLPRRREPPPGDPVRVEPA
ncbi:hypothetical protein GCM10020254_44370 [Streptomyces goshikiensis]